MAMTIKSYEDLPPMVITWDTTRVNKTGSWRYVRPVYRDKTPPCSAGCPAANDIERVLLRVACGDLEAAWERLVAENPFPAITGRVCHHPCEAACNRRQFDEPLAIREVERFVGDWGLRAGKRVRPLVERKSGHRVAVVGAGPAGLACAYHLARLGHKVTVFEANPEPGGVLRYGIPDYRLPKDVLKAELRKLDDLGVELVTNARVGRDVPWEELQQHDAIFVATGVWRSRRLNVPGEDLQGVLSGLEFLKALNSGQRVELGERVAVIGGGNTAMDVARSALRLGKRVLIAYRRTREEMPAIPEEIEEALAEGAELMELVAPVRVLEQNGRVAGIELQKMRLGEPDESGRRRPVPIEGSEFTLDVDTVITAIGEAPDFAGLPEELYQGQSVVPIDELGRAPLQKVFAGGDIVDQPHTVVDAIASGKRAAIAIDLFLKGRLNAGAREALQRSRVAQGGLSMRRYLEDPEALMIDNAQTVEYDQLNTAYFRKAKRLTAMERPAEARVQDFAEVKLGFDADEATMEAERCFHCGVCNECDNCWVFCPDFAVQRDASANGDGRPYLIDYDYCKGCGICAHECPRHVIELVREGQAQGQAGEG